jgi:hypothetical protein
MDILTRKIAGDPLAFAARHRGAPIETHRKL